MKEETAPNSGARPSSSRRGTDFLLAAGLACLILKRPNRKGPEASGQTEKHSAAAPEPPSAAAVEPEEAEASAGTPPQFRLCLLTPYGSAPREPAPAWRGALASAVVHGVSIAGLIAAGNSEVKYPQHSYHLEVLHLRPGTESSAAAELWNSLHRAVPRRAQAARRIKGRAPQTIMVADAPPEVKLSAVVPAPLAVSIPQLPQRSEEPVALREPRQIIADDTAPASPAVAVLSLPRPGEVAPDTALLPKVSEVAGADTITTTAATQAGGSSTGDAPQPIARTNVPNAETAREAIENVAASFAPLPSSVGSQQAPGGAIAGLVSAAERAGTRSPDPAAGPAPDVARIELPPDGKPRASVLAESPYMPGHIVATIYLKMGVPRTWTLEYWIPGSATSLTAPWPYLMLRPKVNIPALADTLLVRGRLTAEGHLEQLCLLGPGALPEQDALFAALGQWKFRPAAKNGSPVAVEILLVIPRQPD